MRRSLILLSLLGTLVAFPSAAQAHGPVSPVASSYLARVNSVPAGIQAKVVDGDQRLWLSVQRSETAIVLDYQGAPYLRFSPSGVSVNAHSAMYYLNHTPAETPPTSITRATPPDWRSVSGGHDYVWHDGRLHALASVAISSGTSLVGTWRISVLTAGRLSAISGGLWHASDPSLVWFWPIVVLLACVLAAVRLRNSALDLLLARALGVTALAATTLGGIGRELYGRPTVGAFQLIVIGIVAAFALWALPGAVRGQWVPLLVIAFAALWVGGLLVPTLLHGFVLMAIPAFPTRAAAVACLACAPAVVLLVFRLALSEDRSDPQRSEAGHDGLGAKQSFA